MSSKLKTLDELQAITASARRQGQKVVFTNGCFDLLHRGHVRVLRASKALGDLLIVALNSDRSVRTIKGSGRPVLSEIDRVELIAAMAMVDYVTLFDEPEPSRLIEALRPDVLTKGGDWPADEIVGADLVRGYGGEVVVIPYLEGFSTTEIINRIRS
ncbi:MAG TPA: D-glycero-beta-D-manno-heptose 1-phosphate adenylyltransferase [Candidatus Eisenbacteria bacterium]|nr:D-glycero-beta-D-manno-heptose 1-phosphate adenylyltransferase [Candidatus Eisenbacteria bacterium]